MKPLREWILEERDKYPSGGLAYNALSGVLNELSAREDIEQGDDAIEGTPIHEVPLLYEDARPITAIYWESEAGAEHTVGRDGVTKIVPYLDHTTLWFAVYQGDFLSRRVPAYEVCVLYANTGDKT